jgi:PST family polysaccharide transporter
LSDEQASYRQIVKSTVVVGGATAGSIAIGLVRTKIFALLLGPLGIGLLGLLQAILGTATTMFQLGFQVSGVRQVAATEADPEASAVARAALWSLTWPLGVAGALLLWLARVPVAQLATGATDHAGDVGLLGIGVWLTVISTTQLAVLQGYRRIGALARVKLWSALVGAVIGIGLVYWLREAGIVWAIVAMPLASILVAHYYHPSFPKWAWRDLTLSALTPEWLALIKIGAAVTLSGMVAHAAGVVARALIVREGGLDSAGLFQAAWGVSSTNLTLLLGAMSADYFPRVSAVAADPEKVGRLVHQQLGFALLAGGPLLVAMSGGAPLVLQLLYSSQFTGAAHLLQWQLMGDAMKLVGWALGIVLLARQDTQSYLASELGFPIVYLGLLAALLPRLGIEAAGIAYFCSYAIYSAAIALICWKRHRIAVPGGTYGLAALLVLLLAALLVASTWSATGALIAGILMALALGGYAVHRLEELAVPGSFARLLALLPGRRAK